MIKVSYDVRYINKGEIKCCIVRIYRKWSVISLSCKQFLLDSGMTRKALIVRQLVLYSVGGYIMSLNLCVKL